MGKETSKDHTESARVVISYSGALIEHLLYAMSRTVCVMGGCLEDLGVNKAEALL